MTLLHDVPPAADQPENSGSLEAVNPTTVDAVGNLATPDPDYSLDTPPTEILDYPHDTFTPTPAAAPEATQRPGLLSTTGRKIGAAVGAGVVLVGAGVATTFALMGSKESKEADPTPKADGTSAPVVPGPNTASATATTAPTPAKTAEATQSPTSIPTTATPTPEASAPANVLTQAEINKYLSPETSVAEFLSLPKDKQLAVVYNQYAQIEDAKWNLQLIGGSKKLQSTGRAIFVSSPAAANKAITPNSAPQDIIDQYAFQRAFAGTAVVDPLAKSADLKYSPDKAQKFLAGVFWAPQEHSATYNKLNDDLGTATAPSDFDTTYTASAVQTEGEIRHITDENGNPLTTRDVDWTETSGTIEHHSTFVFHTFQAGGKDVTMALIWKDTLNVK